MPTNNSWNVAEGTTGQLLVATTSSAGAYASSALADFSFTSATAGTTRTLTVSNTDNTNTGSIALLQTTTGGGSAGDPFHTYTITGATSFSQGLDNSDSDAYVIAASTALGTTNVVRIATTGEINFPLQSAFNAYIPSNVNNVTGDGTVFTLGTTTAFTEVIDQNSDFNTNGTFTAPVTGCYAFYANILLGGGTTITNAHSRLTTSNATYIYFGESSVGTSINMQMSILADLDAADTCSAQIQTTDFGGKVDDVMGAARSASVTWFMGNLVC